MLINFSFNLTKGLNIMKTLIFIFILSFSLQAAGQVVTSTVDDQKKVAVTVYNSGFGVVRDERVVTLPTGVLDLKFMDVASSIQPETVQIEGKNLSVLEQNYEYDLMSPEKLLEKYVGKNITLIQYNPYNNERIPIDAKLLSYNNQKPIYKIDDKIVINRQYEEIKLPSIPENLVSKPTLIWNLENNIEKKQNIVANYMTRGMRWNADYVMVLAENEKACNINGWVTLNNNCGTTFIDAQLKLVAGDVNKVQPERRNRGYGIEQDVMFAKSAPSFKEESMFEYHLYTLDRPTTLKQNQQKQISLLESSNIGVDKTFRYIGNKYIYRNKQGGTDKSGKIGVFVSFVNSKKNNLGMPLPKGIVRVYKADSSGNNQFVGEDRIDHTPKDEEIELKLGDAFDVVAERRQTDYKKIGNRSCESAWEIKVKNHKTDNIVVEIVEPFFGDWEILETSLPFEKKDAWTAVYKVPVKADGQSTITYRVRIKW